MSVEYAGITIIIDQGAERTIINVPEAADVETFTAEPSLPVTMANVFGIADAPFWRDPIYHPTVGLRFRPIGEFTIREETVPMRATPATDMSEREQSKVGRFGIHDEDQAVW